jgi:hypothetical protein
MHKAASTPLVRHQPNLSCIFQCCSRRQRGSLLLAWIRYDDWALLFGPLLKLSWFVVSSMRIDSSYFFTFSFNEALAQAQNFFVRVSSLGIVYPPQSAMGWREKTIGSSIGIDGLVVFGNLKEHASHSGSEHLFRPQWRSSALFLMTPFSTQDR